MKRSVRHKGQVIGLIVAAVALHCQQPIEPDSTSRQRGIGTSESVTEQPPEEEILGSVYTDSNEIPSTSREYSVRLTPIIGSGACLFRANASSTCLASSSIPVMPNGSRPDKTFPMWGWFNNLDTDNNPCRAAETDKAEWHDLNHDRIRNDGSVEQHCVKPGRYKVDILRHGSVVRTRIVDHFRVSGTLNLKDIENPAGSSASDTFVHTEVATSVPVSNNVLAIDNPETPTAFAPGDTVVRAGVPVRFDSRAMTTWGAGVPGRLMNRVYFDLEGGLNFRTEYWNPDRVMRTNPYSLGSSSQRILRTRTQIATPSDPTGDTNRNSPERRIVVQSAVATVTVSPSSATITTQNGTVSLTATLRDASGNILTGRPISWSSSNTTIATVSGSGSTATVTGKMNGTVVITATSEGKSGTATITVSIGTDNAAAAGNTLPTSFENGSAVSVSVSMQNSGGSTWTSSAGYALDLSRDQSVWAVSPSPVGTSGVSPGATKSFAFTLRTDDPTRRGLTACFFQMARNWSLFGGENGKDINVTGPKIISGGVQAMTTEGIASLGFDPAGLWLQGAVDDGTTRIPLDAAAFRQTDVLSLSYAYAHEAERSIDVVFKYVYDPAVFEPLPLEAGLSGVTIQAGVAAPGEYWVRFTGTVPEGNGLIAGLPFRLLPGAKAPRQSTATLTIYQLQS